MQIVIKTLTKLGHNIFSIIVLSLIMYSSSLVFNTESGIAGGAVVACFVTIVKEAAPQDNTEFNFTQTGDVNEEFLLSDPGNPSEDVTVFAGTPVTITEQMPAGWLLNGIDCQANPDEIIISEVANGRTFSCETLDGQGTCTFKNSKTTVVTSVPTLTEWGMIAMAAVLCIAGVLFYRKRNILA